MLYVTHKIRLITRTESQRKSLEQALEVSRTIYNAALEERSSAWSRSKKRITRYDQQRSLTSLSGDESLAGLPVNLLRWPLVKLNQSYNAFFKRVKTGQAPGHPRFRSKGRYHTFGYTDHQCWKVHLDRKVLHLSRIGWFRLRLHRPIEGNIRSLQIRREGRHWYALIGVAVSVNNIHPHPESEIGIDAGIRHHLTLSTGETIENLRLAERHSSKVRRAQRKLARAQKSSKGRRAAREALRKVKRKEANARRTRAHQISANLTQRYATIVVEKLQLNNMLRKASGTSSEPGSKVAQKRGLNRSLYDVAINDLYSKLDYKAERAGGTVIYVDPRKTSQECSGCSAVIPKALSERRHVCSCGIDLDRDHNAAINVLKRGVAVPGGAKPTVTSACLEKVV